MLYRSLAVTCLCLVLCSTVWASAKKEDITAAMVYRLTKFVEWPTVALPQEEGSFRICFDEPTPVFERLRLAELKKWRGRSVEVVVELEKPCHVLVVNSNKPPENLKNTLVIGTTDDFLELGGHICLKFVRGRLAFSVNRSAATRAGLNLSSDLLGLASEVL